MTSTHTVVVGVHRRELRGREVLHVTGQSHCLALGFHVLIADLYQFSRYACMHAYTDTQTDSTAQHIAAHAFPTSVAFSPHTLPTGKPSITHVCGSIGVFDIPTTTSTGSCVIVYAYIFAYAYTCVCMYVYICINFCVCMYISIYVYRYIYIYRYLYAICTHKIYMYVRICAKCIHTYILNIRIHTHDMININGMLHTPRSQDPPQQSRGR